HTCHVRGPSAAYCIALCGRQGLPRLERIVARRLELVDIPLPGQVRSLTAHVSDSEDGILGYIVLHVKVPLLHVRIVYLSAVVADTGRAGQAVAADVVV